MKYILWILDLYNVYSTLCLICIVSCKYKWINYLISAVKLDLRSICEWMNLCYFISPPKKWRTQNILATGPTITRKTKITIYKTIIRPVVTYGSETWTLIKSAENILNTWERKVLRRIFGPTKDEKGWRMHTNNEVYE